MRGDGWQSISRLAGMAEGLLYSLVAPRFNPVTNLGSDARLPVDRTLFPALADTALTSLRAAPDNGPPSAIGPQATVALTPLVEAYSQVSSEPLVISGALSGRVVAGIREGAIVVQNQQYDVAVPLLERAFADAPVDQPALRTGLARDLSLAQTRGSDRLRRR